MSQEDVLRMAIGPHHYLVSLMLQTESHKACRVKSSSNPVSSAFFLNNETVACHVEITVKAFLHSGKL